MQLLDPRDYGKIVHLFEEMPYHLAPFAILHGVATGNVFVNDLSQPRAALIQTKYRNYLAGDPQNAAFNQSLRRYYLETVYPQGLQAGQEAFILFYPTPTWGSALEIILEGKYPLVDRREHYQFHAKPGWPASSTGRDLPAGFAVRPITPALLEDDSLESVNDLREEVLSEAASQAEFFEHRFGFCIVEGPRLAAWCLSEYNWRDRCEVGIATVEDYQRRGLATAVGHALVEHATKQGIREIGWDCWQSNRLSAATALKIGFELAHEYPVGFAFYDPVLNLAVQGNLQLRQGEYAAAAAWYEHAFATGEAQAWMYWNAACANARIEEYDDGLKYLRLAHAQGFHDLERMQTSEHLAGLRSSQGFRELIETWYAT